MIVGKSFCHKRKPGEEDRDILVPNGYDSVYLENESGCNFILNI